MKQVIKSIEPATIIIDDLPENGIYAYMNRRGSPLLLVRPGYQYRFCSLTRPLIGGKEPMKEAAISGWFFSDKEAIQSVLSLNYKVYKFENLEELCGWVLQENQDDD